jgi:hypothetical protein
VCGCPCELKPSARYNLERMPFYPCVKWTTMGCCSCAGSELQVSAPRIGTKQKCECGLTRMLLKVHNLHMSCPLPLPLPLPVDNCLVLLICPDNTGKWCRSACQRVGFAFLPRPLRRQFRNVRMSKQAYRALGHGDDKNRPSGKRS